MVLPPCASEMLDGQCLIREVGPYRTSRFQSCSVIEVNSGGQREFRLDSCPDNHSRRSYIYADVLGSMLLRTGSQSVSVQRTARSMVLVVSFSCMSTRLVCAEFLQTGAQYSATY